MMMELHFIPYTYPSARAPTRRIVREMITHCVTKRVEGALPALAAVNKAARTAVSSGLT